VGVALSRLGFLIIMRRRTPISVRVKNPSRGLATRLPPNLADELFDGDQSRVCTVAQNVRFEDGVIKNAGGTARVTLSPALDTCLQKIHSSKLVDGSNPILLATRGKVFSAVPAVVTTPGTFSLALTARYTASNAGTDQYRWTLQDFYDKVILALHGNAPQYYKSSTMADLPGLATGGTYDGVAVFASHILLWKDDVLSWSDVNNFPVWIPVATTISSKTFTINAFTQPAAGASASATITTGGTGASGVTHFGVGDLTAGQYVRIWSGTSYSFYTVAATPAADATSVSLTRLDLTGSHATATNLAGTSLLTLDANEAGSAQNVGADINGPIFAVVPMGDYAYIFKERSIQSLQYVGTQSGIFYAHTENSNEGLISRNAYVKLGNGRIIFLGQRELYDYRGGASPQPICVQYTRQLFEELDRANLDSIFMFHREDRNEVHIFYPALSDARQKILIWNYAENTCSLDYYDYALGTLCAAGYLSFTSDPTWEVVPGDRTWAADTLNWNQYISLGTLYLPVIGTGNETAGSPTYGMLTSYGFNRLGSAYTALAETQDFDFGDDSLFKYIDEVTFQLQVPTGATGTLNVQVGYRLDQDSAITWSSIYTVDVSGNGGNPAKINPGGSGRYIRLRVFSDDADAEWRISSFNIFARAGSSY
jgi:hypothetical protein